MYLHNIMETMSYLLTLLLFLSQGILFTKAEKTVEIDEKSSNVLECLTENVLLIKYATYNGKAAYCRTHEVTSLVQDRCQWKRTCTLHATDDVYTDTCLGPDETLFVKYTCKEDCYYRIFDTLYYNGTISVTESGKKCQWWDDDEPQVPNYRPKAGGQRNYCRNPDKDSDRPWCYTMDPETRWEYCDVEECAISPLLTTTQSTKNGGDSEDSDVPVAIILGVLFGVLVTAIILVVVLLLLKRRGQFKSDLETTGQRRTYIYSAPENNNSLIARARRIFRRNVKNNNEGNVLANNPGYSAMQGERIESLDYVNTPVVNTRVYEMPNTANDQNRQAYASLYDRPNGNKTGHDVNNKSVSNIDDSYENPYEIAQPKIETSKPIISIKPILKKPTPSPKQSPKPSPKPSNPKEKGNEPVHIIKNSDHKHIDLNLNSNLDKPLDDSEINSSKHCIAHGKKSQLAPETLQQSSSASSLVKLQIEKFNQV